MAEIFESSTVWVKPDLSGSKFVQVPCPHGCIAADVSATLVNLYPHWRLITGFVGLRLVADPRPELPTKLEVEAALSKDDLYETDLVAPHSWLIACSTFEPA